jgi:hypothetical protein
MNPPVNETVQCGACVHFARSESGAGRCAARGGVGGGGAHRWPFLVYPNFPIVCGDFEASEPEPSQEAEGQRSLDLGAA